MRIAHIITDEKFPDSAYEMFEQVLPGCNDFILPDLKSPIKHLKKIDPIRVSRYSFLNSRFIRVINGYDALIIHGMSAFSIELINRCSENVSIYWIGMGFDYYDIIYDSRWGMLKKHTREEVIEVRTSFRFMRSALIQILRNARNRVLYPHSNDKKRWVKRVDYFCPVLESEFFSLKEKINNWNACYVDWNYGNSAALVDGEYGENFSLGSNILLGNSASPTNNHIDAFHFLKKNEKFLPDDSKIIVPLSYGDLNYREIVVKEGLEILGDRFFPLTEMVSPREYSKVIESCSLVFMNHIRQQAGNNIAQALYMGARVILDSKNPFYKEYKKHGVFISSLDDIENEPDFLSIPLTAEEKYKNKYSLRELRGSEAAIYKTKKLIESIASN
jgi:hypothetical protein